MSEVQVAPEGEEAPEMQQKPKKKLFNKQGQSKGWSFSPKKRMVVVRVRIYCKHTGAFQRVERRVKEMERRICLPEEP